MTEDCFFVYVDESNVLFYYNCTTCTSSYDRPEVGTLFDPDTGLEWVDREGDAATEPAEEDIFDADNNDDQFTPETTEDDTSGVLDGGLSVPQNMTAFDMVGILGGVGAHVAMIGGLRAVPAPEKPLSGADWEFRAKMKHFASEFFRPRMTKKKQPIPVDVLISWEQGVLKWPLLSRLRRQEEKEGAVAMFKAIIQNEKKWNVQNAVKMLEIVAGMVDMRDEAYFQLIKQTTRNPDQEGCKRTWQLFMIYARMFPSSVETAEFVREYLSAVIARQSEVSDYARFTLAGFEATFSSGRVKQNRSAEACEMVLKDFENVNKKFGATIEEQLCDQKEMYPKLSVPHVLCRLTSLLWTKGAGKTEGVFRIPGSDQKVKDAKTAANKNRDIFDELPLADVASVLKAWFADLTPSLVSGQGPVTALITAVKAGNHIAFAEQMEPNAQNTLRYLIGFLQELSAYSEVTMMTPLNFAICFGPNIVSFEHNVMECQKIIECGNDFLRTLIETWDNRQFYRGAEDIAYPRDE